MPAMECFGDSSSDDDDGGGASSGVKRDESCGVLSFHPNTEASLLAHVRNSMNDPSPSGGQANLQRASDVLQAIDEFCTTRHWMMHVGPEKGEILLKALQAALTAKMEQSPSESNVSFVVVELGTYCGYASILMGRALREASTTMKCHLLSAEINRQYAEVSMEMVRLSCMEDVISVLQISYDGHETDLVRVVGDALKKCPASTVNFLFIDHDKDSYKSDLCKLEASGVIKCGTKVVADNVLFAGIEDYVGYVQQRAKDGVVATRTVPCNVEYSEGNSMQDGVEITDYLRDP
ncbi:hypothetical protein ACHAXT_006079 [Thalassiosira profunda]